MSTMLAVNDERQMTFDDVFGDDVEESHGGPVPIRRVPHPADEEIRAFRTIRERVDPFLAKDRDLDAAVDRFADLVSTVVNHMELDSDDDTFERIPMQHGFTKTRALSLLHALEVRLAQSAKETVDVSWEPRFDPQFNLPGMAREYDVCIPSGAGGEYSPHIAALIYRLSGVDDVRAVVKRFVGRGLAAELIDDGAINTAVGLTADFLLRLHTRLTLGRLDRLPRVIEHPSGAVNVELGYQLVRGWRHLDESRRRAVEAQRRIVDQPDRPTSELLNDVKRAMWLRPQETRRLVALARDIDDDETVRKAIGFYRQRIVRAADHANAQRRREGRHVSSEYEPMCVGHLTVAQLQHLLQLVGVQPDYSTVTDEAADLAATYADHIGQDDDQVGHRISTALLVDGGRDVLIECLQRRKTHTDWDAPLRAHLRTAMPRAF